MAMHMAAMAPLKQIISKAIMQNAIILLSKIENELDNSTSDIRVKQAQTRMIERITNDYVNGFERRTLMLVTSTMVINSPTEMLNGSWLKKLVDAKDGREFDSTSARIQSVFKLKTNPPMNRIIGLFKDYLTSFRNRHPYYTIAIEKLHMEMRGALEEDVSNYINNKIELGGGLPNLFLITTAVAELLYS